MTALHTDPCLLVIGVQDLLKSKCTAKAVCCQRSPSNVSSISLQHSSCRVKLLILQAAGGLINAGLPCIALGSLIQ